MVGRRRSRANNSSASHSISLPVSHSVSDGPQAARSTNDGVSQFGNNDSDNQYAINGKSTMSDPVKSLGRANSEMSPNVGVRSVKSASGQSVRFIYVSASDFFVSDLNGYDGRDYLGVSDFYWIWL